MVEQDIKGYSYGMKIKKFEAGWSSGGGGTELSAAKFALYSNPPVKKHIVDMSIIDDTPLMSIKGSCGRDGTFYVAYDGRNI